MYNFVVETEIFDQSHVEKLYDGSIGVLIIKNSKPEDIEFFGELLPQDMYSTKVIPIGTTNKEEEHVWSTTEMLWHQDRAYNKDVHPFVGLYCIAADEGASGTYFCDMQAVYRDSSDELKNKCDDVIAVNEVAKYFRQAEYPHTFRNKVWERAYKAKAKAEHKLVQEDKHGKFYFYSEAYTIVEFEDELKSISYQDKYIYKHTWSPTDLVVYNNYKVAHKRDYTAPEVDRRHLRFALGKRPNVN